MLSWKYTIFGLVWIIPYIFELITRTVIVIAILVASKFSKTLWAWLADMLDFLIRLLRSRLVVTNSLDFATLKNIYLNEKIAICEKQKPRYRRSQIWLPDIFRSRHFENGLRKAVYDKLWAAMIQIFHGNMSYIENFLFPDQKIFGGKYC